MKSSVKIFFLHGIAYLMIIGFAIGFSVMINQLGPAPRIYRNEDWIGVTPVIPPKYNASQYNIVLDQHSHTTTSNDGCLTLEQNILWHIALGYNTICITDHNVVHDQAAIAEMQEKYARKVIIISGMEWTTDRIHMNFLGLTEWPHIVPISPSNEDIKDAIIEAQRLGAVVSVNHPPQSRPGGVVVRDDFPTNDQLFEWGIDFLEVINDGNYYPNYYDPYSYEYCVNYSKGMITGSDIHSPDDFGSGGTHGWTLLNADNLTVAGVMKELYAHRTTILKSEEPIPDPANHEVNLWYTLLRPLWDEGKIFVDLYSSETGFNTIRFIAGFTYFTLLFLGIEAVRFLLQRQQLHKEQFQESSS